MSAALKKIFVAFLLAALCFGGYAYYCYTGFFGDLAADLRYASLREIKNKYAFFYYYASYYEKLRVNPRTGLYDLSLAAKEYENDPARDDFELGKLSYHQGDFAAAVTEIESDIERRGESEDKLFWVACSYLRLGEAENCLARLKDGAQHDGHSAETGGHSPSDMMRSCSLPVTVFQDKTRGAEEAGRVL